MGDIWHNISFLGSKKTINIVECFLHCQPSCGIIRTTAGYFLLPYSSSVSGLALAVKFNISPGRWQHFPMWPLFLLREKGKQTEMTVTQHVGMLKPQFLHYVTIKMVLVIFHFQNNILVFCTSVIWSQHLPAPSYNFFSADMSRNRQNTPLVSATSLSGMRQERWQFGTRENCYYFCIRE
jgi:hypothetical protein